MTITWPRELPVPRLVECSFTLLDGVTPSPSGRGLVINRTQTVDPTWRLKATTPPLERADRDEWGAWKKSLRGGLRTFVAYDFKKSPPRAYPTAKASTDISGGWGGTATVTSVGASGALALSGLPSTYQAKVGDHVGLQQSGRYGLYEVLEDVTAVAGAVTLTVEPLLHSVFTTAATARLWRPVAQFAIDWQSWQEKAVVGPTPISFEAYQVL